MSEYSLDKSNIFFANYRGRLPEGITYNPSNNTIIWVDIILGEVHRVSITHDSEDHYNNTHQVLKWPATDPPESVGAIGLTSNDNVIVMCCKYGVCLGNFASGTIEYFLKYNHDQEQQTRLRSNDGIIDPWGHLWIGVMSDFPITKQEGGPKPEGKLYRINCHDLTIETMVDDCFISNGLNFSANGKKFYWTDSLTYTIWQYDYDYISNTLYNKQPFVQTREILPSYDSPEPDGLTIDKNDEIYSAVFSTGRVFHYDTKGSILETFHLPAARVTCVTIGGKNNDELFITTAFDKVDDFSAHVDPHDKHDGSDLGGYLYRIQLDRCLHGRIKYVWGGKI